MDFSLTPEEEKLSLEFKEFFEKEMSEAPADWQGGLDDPFFNDENWAFHVKMARKLGERGWLTLSWPEVYGGLNASPTSQMLFNELAGYYKVPGVDMVGVKMMGPVIYLLGTEEQKKEHLKPIARGERFWCQGWSEPDAGSDLAALSTHATREGDSYIVNGQKLWTTGAHKSDWIFLLVRSQPDSKRSKGLTFLLADMKTPGISVEPIHLMNGHHSFNEVFLDNVKIPAINRIGEENKGWKVTKTLSNFERSGALPVSYIERDLEDLISYCKEATYQGDLLINDNLVRHRLSAIAAEVEVARAMIYRITCLHETGEFVESVAASSAAKVHTAELYQRLVYDGSHILGLNCQVKGGSRWAPLKGIFERNYQFCMGWNIAAGTSEIQRNVIAWTALGLPRV
ncbi:acyl-CoA dehydrogenase family protein [Thermodesulfobacteriota bacterium]